MPNYIDKDTFQKFLEDEIEETKCDMKNSCGDEYYEMAVESRECALREVLSKLKREPTADVREISRGRWELIGKNVSKCTVCGCARNIRTQIGWNFCPVCGAKMGLED